MSPKRKDPIDLSAITDRRHPECTHEANEGCWRCCQYCNHVTHRCGGCGKPLEHTECLGQVGCCEPCRKEYFTDQEREELGL